MQEDLDNVMACEAYRDKETGRCKINNLICSDGDCRKCSFIVDGSLMITLQNVCQRMDLIMQHMGITPDECGCGCGCEGDCHCGE